MALVVPCLLNGTTAQQCTLVSTGGVLGSCLVDMAIEGLLSENDVDSFNLPRYYASQQELETIIKRNGSFSIERIELLDRSKIDGGTVRVPPSMVTSYFRALLEGLLNAHFRVKIGGGLFDLVEKGIEESSMLLDPGTSHPANCSSSSSARSLDSGVYCV